MIFESDLSLKKISVSKIVCFVWLYFACLLPIVSFSQGSDPIENAGRPMTPLEKHIHAVSQQVVDGHKTTDKLSEKDLADLPIGIVRQIGNKQYVIAIDSAYWDG